VTAPDPTIFINAPVASTIASSSFRRATTPIASPFSRAREKVADRPDEGAWS
jgi:Zn-dependent protease with chaperone function